MREGPTDRGILLGRAEVFLREQERPIALTPGELLSEIDSSLPPRKQQPQTLGASFNAYLHKAARDHDRFGYAGNPHKFYLLDRQPDGIDEVETSARSTATHKTKLRMARRIFEQNVSYSNRLLDAVGVSGNHPIIIRAVRNALVKELNTHPDLGGDHDTMVRLNLAYEKIEKELQRNERPARNKSTRYEHNPQDVQGRGKLLQSGSDS